MSQFPGYETRGRGCGNPGFIVCWSKVHVATRDLQLASEVRCEPSHLCSLALTRQLVSRWNWKNPTHIRCQECYGLNTQKSSPLKSPSVPCSSWKDSIMAKTFLILLGLDLSLETHILSCVPDSDLGIRPTQLRA